MIQILDLYVSICTCTAIRSQKTVHPPKLNKKNLDVQNKRKDPIKILEKSRKLAESVQKGAKAKKVLQKNIEMLLT